MLLFSSRDHLTLPGVCLWVLIIAVRLQCSYAFDILSSHKSAAPSSPLLSLSSSSSPSTAPSLEPSLSSYISQSSPKLHSLSPTNKLFVRHYQQHAKPLSSFQSIKRSFDATPTHLDGLLKRAIARLIPPALSSRENLISFVSDNEVRPLQHPTESLSRILGGIKPDSSRTILDSSKIASMREKQKLQSYFQHVEKMKSLKNNLRRRMKEKALLQSKLLKAVKLKKNRLSKMANVEVVALAKSPPQTQLFRSIKARRANYRKHDHPGHSGRHKSENVHFPSGSFGGFSDNDDGGDGGFINPENTGIFHSFESEHVPSRTDGFTFEHLPKDTQVDFVVDGQGFFSPPSPDISQHPHHSSPLSSSSFFPSSSSSSAQNHFGHFSSLESNGNSFGHFLDAPGQGTWEELPPRHHSEGFDVLIPSHIPSSAVHREEGGFHISPHFGGDFVASASSNTKPRSDFSDDGGFLTGFGSFQQDDRDCAAISTKTCSSSLDCTCNGFYTCIASRCVLKGSNRVDSFDDSMGGMWHDDPVMESVMTLTPE